MPCPYFNKTNIGFLVVAIVGIASLFGFTISSEDQSKLVEQIVAGLATIASIAGIVNKVVTTKQANADAKESAKDEGGNVPPWMQLAIVGALLVGLTGCASNVAPEVQVARQQQAFTVGLRAINASIQNGTISKEQARKLAPFVRATNAALEEAQVRANIVATLKAQLAVATDPADKAQIQAQLNVAQDTFLQAMGLLNALLDAFNQAKENPDGITVEPPATTAPQSTASGDIEPARFGRSWLDPFAHRPPAFAGA